ncbi:Nidogen-like protein [Ancylostoma ceylanicum]|uniref:Nidogen-like protein n=1 Tax=Ancylostoma ceylanicum TaxID=53326 RepID=A0A0D6LPI1_9BILA|nr:Nidogen-like protein [Ancylostoma ceylanicum]
MPKYLKLPSLDLNKPVSIAVTTRSITRCPRRAPETSCTWRSMVTLAFLASGCLNWARPEWFDVSRASRETPVMKNAQPESGELTALRAAIVVKARAIHSQANAQKDVPNAGWVETVKRRKKTATLGHLPSVLRTPSLLRTTTAVASRYRDANVCQDSLVMDTRTAMIVTIFPISLSVKRLALIAHVPDVDECREQVLWQLKSPMKLFGNSYDRITVTTSGLLSLTDVSKASGEKLEEMKMTGIAPFFAPIDTSRGGHVTVAEVTDSETLTRVTRSIQENYDEPSFQAKSVLIVTYMNVTDGKAPVRIIVTGVIRTHFSYHILTLLVLRLENSRQSADLQKKGNTFQTLLISGTNNKREKMTFAELLYKDMQWGEGAEAGIMTNDVSSSVTLPGSGTQGMEQLAQLSNVGQPGVWLFRIDEPSIQPCPLAGQQPPFCQKKTRPTDRILPSRIGQKTRPPLVAQNVEARPENVPAGAVPVGAPRIIQPQLEPIRGHNSLPNTPLEVSVTTAPLFPERSTSAKTARPRPRYESTPHRPIVSLGDRDFEELGPDVFEITFPPFVTVIPEVFNSKTTKQLPDFTVQESVTTTTRRPSTVEATFPTFKLSDTHETLVTVQPVNSEPEATTTTKKTAPVVVSATTGEPLNDEDVFEVQVEPETVSSVSSEPPRVQIVEKPIVPKIPETRTTEEVVTERQTVTPSTTAAHVFVFTTTPKPTTRPAPKRPHIVTAGTTTTVEPEEDREAAASKMAIIIPSVIVVVWIMLLIAIALFVCCRRRSSSAQLRPYGPVYSVQPTAYALKRNGKHVEGSYEDHLEKAARISNEMNAYNQVINLKILKFNFKILDILVSFMISPYPSLNILTVRFKNYCIQEKGQSLFHWLDPSNSFAVVYSIEEIDPP